MRWAKIVLPFAAVLCTGTLLVNGFTGGAGDSNNDTEGFFEAFETAEGSGMADAETEFEAAEGSSMAGAETENDSDSADSERDVTGVMDEYRSFLGMDDIPWTGGERIFTEGLKFMTEDVNGDGIPELFVKSPVDVYGTMGIYSRNKSGICDICYGDDMGWYYPGTGVFVVLSELSKDGNPVKETEVYYYLEDISERTEPIEGRSFNVGVHIHYFDEREDQYMLYDAYDGENGEEYAETAPHYISQAEFEGKLSELTGSASKTNLDGSWIENTKENREKYLQ